MPRRTLLRRFEPRYGVTEPMMAAEAKWLGRELDDYLLLSANELSENRSERYEKSRQNWEMVQSRLAAIGERERSAVEALLFRDIFHILELYRAQLKAADSPVRDSPAPMKPEPSEFSEWLFA